jgi:hypothetical protein
MLVNRPVLAGAKANDSRSTRRTYFEQQQTECGLNNSATCPKIYGELFVKPASLESELAGKQVT